MLCAITWNCALHTHTHTPPYPFFPGLFSNPMAELVPNFLPNFSCISAFHVHMEYALGMTIQQKRPYFCIVCHSFLPSAFLTVSLYHSFIPLNHVFYVHYFFTPLQDFLTGRDLAGFIKLTYLLYPRQNFGNWAWNLELTCN